MNCNVCKTAYDGQDREPLMPPCGHSICRGCFRKTLGRPNDSRVCPVCRKALPTSEPPLNVDLLKVVEQQGGAAAPSAGSLSADTIGAVSSKLEEATIALNTVKASLGSAPSAPSPAGPSTPSSLGPSTAAAAAIAPRVADALKAGNLDAAEEAIAPMMRGLESHLPQLLSKWPASKASEALYAAADGGKTSVVRAILASKCANLEYKNDLGITPLFAAAHEGHTEIVDMLLKAGVNKDAVAYNGATPILSAAQNGHLPVVRSLIRAGAKLDRRAEGLNGMTPLHFAVSFGHPHIVVTLLEAGADAFMRDGDGDPPIKAGRHTTGPMEHMACVMLLGRHMAAVGQRR